MFGLDYIDAAIIMGAFMIGCFLLSVVRRLYSAGEDHLRR